MMDRFSGILATAVIKKLSVLGTVECPKHSSKSSVEILSCTYLQAKLTFGPFWGGGHKRRRACEPLEYSDKGETEEQKILQLRTLACFLGLLASESSEYWDGYKPRKEISLHSQVRLQ